MTAERQKTHTIGECVIESNSTKRKGWAGKHVYNTHGWDWTKGEVISPTINERKNTAFSVFDNGERK